MVTMALFVMVILLASAHAIAQDMLGAMIHTCAALDTFGAVDPLVRSAGYVVHNVNSHRTDFTAISTGNAIAFFCNPDMYARKMQASAEPAAQYHKRSHPAKIMAKYPLSEEDGGNKDQAHNAIVNHIALNGRNRNPVLRFKEKINRRDRTGVKIANGNDSEPNSPYDEFDEISPSLFWFFIIDDERTFL